MAYQAKVASIFILFVMTFLFGILPSGVIKLLKKRKKNPQTIAQYVGVLNCLSGGVFFGTVVLHMLPESMETLEEYVDFEYPIAGALTGAGFFLVLTIEHIVGKYHGNIHSHGTASSQSESRNTSIAQTRYHSASGKFNSKVNDINGNRGEIAAVSYIKTTDIDTGSVEGARRNKDVENERKDVNDGVQTGEKKKSMLKLRTLVLLLAFSLHMVFEGLAVGLQNTNSEVWELLGILMLHKCIVAFSVGLQLDESVNSFCGFIWSLIGFSVVAPLGVGIGFLVSEYGGSGYGRGIASGVLQSLATGTFFYVTFFEILQKELSHEHNLWKVFSAIIGFLIIIGVQFAPDND